MIGRRLSTGLSKIYRPHRRFSRFERFWLAYFIQSPQLGGNSIRLARFCRSNRPIYSPDGESVRDVFIPFRRDTLPAWPIA